MKKLTLAILMLLGTFSISSAEIGVNIGVSGQMGVFHADGFESDKNTAGSSTEKSSGDATGVFGYGSIFIEKELGRIAIGIDYVPKSFSTDRAENSREDIDLTNTAGGGRQPSTTTKLNTIQVDVEDLTTVYLALNLTENLYIKGGITSVDVITNESLATGSAYGNASLDGTVMAIGYNKDFDNGMFLRLETSYMDFDGITLTSVNNSGNSVTLSGIEGASGKLAIGKSF